MRHLLIVGLCVILIGCASSMSKLPIKPWGEPQYGMTRDQMLDLLGKPEAVEIYKKSDDSRVEYYIYTRKNESSQDRVPVCVVDKKVVGWGKTYYEDHVGPDIVRIK